MGAALPIADHHDASELRASARREKNGRAASRMVATADALDGMTRLAAAWSAGMDRQTLRDWVIRDNADGIDGLCDQPKKHNPQKLTERSSRRGAGQSLPDTRSDARRHMRLDTC